MTPVADIIRNQRISAHRCTVTMISKAQVNILQPDPATIFENDIAHHLARIERYNGGTPEFLPSSMSSSGTPIAVSINVAVHSITVAKLLPKPLRLWGLMHDASEAYLGDSVSPLKNLLPDYRELEENMMLCIAKKFKLSWPMPREVRVMDKAVTSWEMGDLMGWQDNCAQTGQKPISFSYEERHWTEIKAEFLDLFKEFSNY